jgi:Uma2 family endonuclease
MVDEYWIVDPTENLILVHILNEKNQYDKTQEYNLDRKPILIHLLKEDSEYRKPLEYKLTENIAVNQIKDLFLNLEPL